MTKAISPLLPVVYSAEVAAAKQREAPIVALDTAVVTRGIPAGIDIAFEVDQIIRDQGAVPARIAVLHGALCIGLEDEQLEQLVGISKLPALSRADLAFAIAERRTGAATVAATMIAAARSGIRVMATDAIGGVGTVPESEAGRISPDLDEFRRSPVITVCSGILPFRDIAASLRLLEAAAVPVVTFGSDGFPAYWSRFSGLESHLSLNSPAAIANFQRVRQQLGIDGGMLVANPATADNEISTEEMEIYISRAMANAERVDVADAELQAWVLRNILKLTDGRSQETAVSLIQQNAALAAEIAVALL